MAVRCTGSRQLSRYARLTSICDVAQAIANKSVMDYESPALTIELQALSNNYITVQQQLTTIPELPVHAAHLSQCRFWCRLPLQISLNNKKHDIK